MRLFGLFVIRFRMVKRSRFQTFAARLLPGLGRASPAEQPLCSRSATGASTRAAPRYHPEFAEALRAFCKDVVAAQ
jgi:hypothetical protein